ncbi:hypothetical protein GCM10023210_14230 [Chryseobacterium ginsengisoli]|uniref:VCBS repeat-containing protein n=1 Tax=Chryseobacterium ginsengisoli TaxID=363853 RepID=A0ABP9M573_9FLAO
MKQIIFAIFILLSKSLFAQKTFRVDNFSDKYYGKVFIADTKEVFSKGWVAVYEKGTNKELIKVSSDEITYELHNGKVLANIKELPYGEQSQILYQDFNFDGVKDFAIMDGQNSCYHGPSFKVYLATGTKFKFSPDFTSLAQDYCGMFNIDYKSKIISTMTKSGCCWHQFSEFKVKNNSPYPIKVVAEEMNLWGFIYDYDEDNLVNGKMVSSKYQKLDAGDLKDKIILSFEFEKKKRMYLINSDSTLLYVFTDKNDKIELLYPEDFKYSKTENTLSFKKYNTQFIIFDDKIVAKTPTKSMEMKPVSKTKTGTLTRLDKLSLQNILY